MSVSDHDIDRLVNFQQHNLIIFNLWMMIIAAPNTFLHSQHEKLESGLESNHMPELRHTRA